MGLLVNQARPPQAWKIGKNQKSLKSKKNYLGSAKTGIGLVPQILKEMTVGFTIILLRTAVLLMTLTSQLANCVVVAEEDPWFLIIKGCKLQLQLQVDQLLNQK